MMLRKWHTRWEIQHHVEIQCNLSSSSAVNGSFFFKFSPFLLHGHFSRIRSLTLAIDFHFLGFYFTDGVFNWVGSYFPSSWHKLGSKTKASTWQLWISEDNRDQFIQMQLHNLTPVQLAITKKIFHIVKWCAGQFEESFMLNLDKLECSIVIWQILSTDKFPIIELIVYLVDTKPPHSSYWLEFVANVLKTSSITQCKKVVWLELIGALLIFTTLAL